MPLNNVTIANPYADGDISEGWAYCSLSEFNWATKTLRLRYATYTSKAAADAGKAPIRTSEYFYGPDEFLPLLGANAATYVSLASVLDGLVTAKPEFAGATVEAAWTDGG